MVIIVALGLSFTHQVLSEKQTTNVHIDKMQQILRSLNIDASAADAQAQYNELIKNAYLIDSEGKKVEGTEGITPDDPAFSTEAGGENAAGLPVFEANVNGSVKYVLPMRGTGLWGPIWGYLAVDADGSTILVQSLDMQVKPLGWVQRLCNHRFGVNLLARSFSKKDSSGP